MPKMFLVFIVLLAGIISCSAQDCLKSSGVITGYDFRECACCGGYFIEIDNTKYRFDELPEGSELNLLNNPEFPINVKLDWIPDSVACMPDMIIIQKIEKETEE